MNQSRPQLVSSIYLLLTPVMLLFGMLACAGTVLNGQPVYVCPTIIPPTTMPWTPFPPGMPTPVPPLPPPSATPYVMQAPQDFYRGDAVFVQDGSIAVRFRLGEVRSITASAARGQQRRIYMWALEVKNVGTALYEIFPWVQMVLSSVNTSGGVVEGRWGASGQAARAAGITLDADVYTLAPDETRTFQLATYAPAGQAHRFALNLDPTSSHGGQITWRNQANPYCTGDVSDDSVP